MLLCLSAMAAIDSLLNRSIVARRGDKCEHFFRWMGTNEVAYVMINSHSRDAMMHHISTFVRDPSANAATLTIASCLFNLNFSFPRCAPLGRSFRGSRCTWSNQKMTRHFYRRAHLPKDAQIRNDCCFSARPFISTITASKGNAEEKPSRRSGQKPE